jgi:hypothetical protein
MLAVVALWAMVPALACLTSAPCHSCCRAMMTDCDMATVGAVLSCCQLHSSSTALPPERVVAPEPLLGPAQALALTAIPDCDDFTGQSPLSSEAPPPRSHSGAKTILRI